MLISSSPYTSSAAHLTGGAATTPSQAHEGRQRSKTVIAREIHAAAPRQLLQLLHALPWGMLMQCHLLFALISSLDAAMGDVMVVSATVACRVGCCCSCYLLGVNNTGPVGADWQAATLAMMCIFFDLSMMDSMRVCIGSLWQAQMHVPEEIAAMMQANTMHHQVCSRGN
ncbi:unnamed protein product [Urochloa humidicola]